MTTYDGSTTPRITITSQTGENVPQIQDGEMWILPANTSPVTFTIRSSKPVRLDKLNLHLNGFVKTLYIEYLGILEERITDVRDHLRDFVM